MPIQIDKDLPIPTGGRGRPAKYPWADMEVGDSFLSPDQAPNTMSNVRLKAEKRTGFKFTTRAEGDGTRIWRIA